ncbi:MAG TPA: urea carboxylase-associated family protein [Candidatus Dormibacteraeota bacterium]|nr:urea carboxylase-associated family protein [Candidatus Dormibacteraeota bacterium]
MSDQDQGPESDRRSPPVASIEEVLVPARTAATVELRRGAQMEIVDVDGKQVADLVAFVLDDFTEWLSPAHTRGSFQSLRLRAGGELVSNRRRPIFRVAEDHVGVHDLLFAMCDEARYRQDYGLPHHANCRDNLTAAYAPWGFAGWQIPDPVNVFQNSPVDEQGGIASAEPLSGPGDRLVLDVLVDVLVGVSACPQDQNPCNGWNPTPILLRLHHLGSA